MELKTVSSQSFQKVPFFIKRQRCVFFRTPAAILVLSWTVIHPWEMKKGIFLFMGFKLHNVLFVPLMTVFHSSGW